MTSTELPRWSLADVHQSIDARSFAAALEQSAADVDRLVVLFDELGIRATEPREPTAVDGDAATRAIDEMNRVSADLAVLRSYAYCVVSADSRDTPAQSALGESRRIDAVLRPLSARLADWAAALGVDALADLSAEVDAHRGPLTRLAARSEHQMSEAEEHLAAELGVTGSSAWARLHNDVTSQLTTLVELPTGDEVLPMPAVRGLASRPSRP